MLTRIRERLDQLALRTRYPGILTQPQKDGSFVVIECFSAPRSIEFSYPIGFHFPKDAPAKSRAVIAWLSDDRISVWLDRLEPRSFTSKTIVSRAAVEQELRDIRERGYSRSIGEHYDSMAALALPIFDRNGDVAYLLCVMGILDAIRKHERDLARAMQDTVLDIHQVILAKPPRSFQL